MRLALLLLIFPATLLGQAGAHTVVAPPTPEDIAEAMRDSVWGFGPYQSDGSARGDSTRRFAALGMTDLEGGDRERGLRLVRAARERGLRDSTFYLHAGLFLSSMRMPDEALAAYEVATTRWPALAWAWEGKARTLRALGRGSEAEMAEQRALELRARPK